MQFPDSENVQRNLETAQIPKLRGTYTHLQFLSKANHQPRNVITLWSIPCIDFWQHVKLFLGEGTCEL